MEEPERCGIPIRGALVTGGITTMFRESLLERPDELLGFVATQLLVPVSTDEPRATRARGWITEGRGVV